ncbi:TIR domain-containing protein [Arthrobacter sp. ISL-72]|uniref:TIR domain-containing protein n=1 Tax=Arthrobacter sp. ISL-72 TaxID=2819114 RepID=UPI001BEB73CA|nr:TIR domain-containing protein [Arthrobacter sp. ISL-72]MBT2594561.1 TIR domain-containing protein [Arthrobacter sp. ISL-72]
MTDTSNAGFWGYAHLDDKADGGRVTRLAEKIRLEYQALTTQELEIFVDRTSLSWGQQWRGRISESLQTTTFYIPVITPNFIDSKECRKEFLTFVNTAKSLGVSEYILAIRYIPVPDLKEDSTDDIKALVASTQFEDWEALRFEDEDGPMYRRAVNKLALRLKELSELVESRPSTDAVTHYSEVHEETEENEDAPGLLDLIADFQPVSEEWLETVNSIPPLLQDFTAIMNEGASDLSEVSDKPFAQRILVFRNMAKKLEPTTVALEERGAEYISRLMTIDPMVRAMIEVSKLAEPGSDAAETARTQFASIKEMAATSASTSATVSTVGAMARSYANYSRDLRPSFKRFDAGMKSIADGQSVIDEWARLVDEAGFMQPAPDLVPAN